MRLLLFMLTAITAFNLSQAQSLDGSYSSWKNGPDDAPSFFPIAVWLQDPALAAQYKKAGFNTYVGLWKGPTEEQLDQLQAAGMKLICEQNPTGLRHLKDRTIIGWMGGDEPDNAQSLGEGKGYGPPISPSEILQRHWQMKAADPTRPVLLNLGQGVAWDGWFGRGTRTAHPEDYPHYMSGGDIISFDIYPVAHADTAISGKLWYVARELKGLCGGAGERRSSGTAWNAPTLGNRTKKQLPNKYVPKPGWLLSMARVD